jgi:hypothetical protein
MRTSIEKGEDMRDGATHLTYRTSVASREILSKEVSISMEVGASKVPDVLVIDECGCDPTMRCEIVDRRSVSFIRSDIT